MIFTSQQFTLDPTDRADRYLIRELLNAIKNDREFASERKIIRMKLAAIEGTVEVIPRPIGKDWLHGCFCCGEPVDDQRSQLFSNTCLMCNTQEEAELVQAMLPGSHIAYYHGDRDRPQVKVGVCDAHRQNLKALVLSVAAGGEINANLVRNCVELNDV